MKADAERVGISKPELSVDFSCFRKGTDYCYQKEER